MGYERTTENTSTNVKNWTPNQHRFLDWLSLPTIMREPLYQSMLAKELGVTEETLCRWKKVEGFEEERQRRIIARMGQDAHDVMGAFIDQAKRGEFQHIKLYFEMMGWHVDKTVGEQNLRVLIQYADQDPNPNPA